MTVVVADTSPVNYLLLIGEVNLLPALFDQVLIPLPVNDELLRDEAPQLVRDWARGLPAWCIVCAAPSKYSSELIGLDPGERAAIELALQRNTAVLMDDSEGRQAALGLGLPVTGTLGLLQRASKAGLIDFEAALQRLLKTNFRVASLTLNLVRQQLK